MASNLDNSTFSNSNNENKNNNNSNNNDDYYNERQQQIPLNAKVSSMSMTSSHLETDTTYSHDHLTGGISRNSSPTPHQSQENDTSSRQIQIPIAENYIHNSSSQQKVPSQENSFYNPPTEPPPSGPPYPMNQNINNFSPPPNNSEPPKYTPPSADQFNSKNNSDVILEAGSPNYNDNNIEEAKASLQTDRSIRMAFVRKVYFLLTMQLLLTIALTVFFMYYEPVKNFVKEHQWLFFVSWIMTFVSLLLLFWQRKRNPLNLFLLLLFTIFMSYGIGTVVSMYSSKVVLQAFLITLGVFLALEVFTFQSKYDFSSWGPFLYAALWIVIFASIIGWLFPYDRGYHIAISVVSALLFSAYIIYDTYMIINRVSPEEYILATVDLYLDVLNLFVAIIAIIGGTSDR